LGRGLPGHHAWEAAGVAVGPQKGLVMLGASRVLRNDNRQPIKNIFLSVKILDKKKDCKLEQNKQGCQFNKIKKGE